jgi:uncharacterized protein
LIFIHIKKKKFLFLNTTDRIIPLRIIKNERYGREIKFIYCIFLSKFHPFLLILRSKTIFSVIFTKFYKEKTINFNMIINFKMKNFKSFKEKSTLNCQKTSKEADGDFFIKNENNIDLLNVISLIGVNGAGKSSLIEGLDFMKSMVLNSHNHNVNSIINYNHFDKNEKPIEFEITFIYDKKKYQYGFSYTRKGIVKEYSYLIGKTLESKTKIFERDEKNLKSRFSFGRNYETELKKKSHDVISTTLMLSRAVQLKSEILKPIYEFFTNIHLINHLFMNVNDFKELKNDNFKEELLDKLTYADFSIENLEVSKTKIKRLKEIKIENDSTVKQEFEDILVDTLFLIHKYKNKDIKINFEAESSGTRKFILLFYNLLKMSKDSIILYDEIENSFNIEIVEFIIKNLAKDKRNSQLIFSTHQPEILNYLRSDQIKIIEKKKSESKVLNLYDIVKSNKKINKNYGEYYKEGVLGGFPNVYRDY